MGSCGSVPSHAHARHRARVVGDGCDVREAVADAVLDLLAVGLARVALGAEPGCLEVHGDADLRLGNVHDVATPSIFKTVYDERRPSSSPVERALRTLLDLLVDVGEPGSRECGTLRTVRLVLGRKRFDESSERPVVRNHEGDAANEEERGERVVDRPHLPRG